MVQAGLATIKEETSKREVASIGDPIKKVSYGVAETKERQSLGGNGDESAVGVEALGVWMDTIASIVVCLWVLLL